MKWALCALVGGLLPAPASAQPPYVAGAVGGEIVRSTSVKSPGSTSSGGSGESWSGAIRFGTLVAPRFGVELEFLRAGQIEGDDGGPVHIAGGVPPVVPGSPIASLLPEGLFPDGFLPDSVLDPTVFPIISQERRLRATTLSTLAFARQPVGGRVDLVYLGGLGFSRIVHETEFGLPRPLSTPDGPRVPSYRTRTTQYGVGPVVGVEARISMTEHLRLVAGVRLHALGQSLVDGWLARPSVGLAWTF